MRWALFLSGRGSTAQALIDGMAQVDLRLVVSSKKNCYGVVRAKRAGIPVFHFGKENVWENLHQELKKRKIQRIFLLGFMKLLPATFVSQWQGKIVNVHPSILPKYPGLNAMESSYKDQADMGVTLHLVTAEMDAGPKLLQKKVLRQGAYSNLNFDGAQLRMALCEQSLIRRVSELERFQ